MSNFKPNLFISSCYNDGLIIKNSSHSSGTSTIKKLVNQTITHTGVITQTINNGIYGFRLDETNRIVSSESYTTKFAFFL